MARNLIQQQVCEQFLMLRNLKKTQQSGGNFDGHMYGWNDIFNRVSLSKS